MKNDEATLKERLALSDYLRWIQCRISSVQLSGPSTRKLRGNFDHKSTESLKPTNQQRRGFGFTVLIDLNPTSALVPASKRSLAEKTTRFGSSLRAFH